MLSAAAGRQRWERQYVRGGGEMKRRKEKHGRERGRRKEWGREGKPGEEGVAGSGWSPAAAEEEGRRGRRLKGKGEREGRKGKMMEREGTAAGPRGERRCSAGKGNEGQKLGRGNLGNKGEAGKDKSGDVREGQK